MKLVTIYSDDIEIEEEAIGRAKKKTKASPSELEKLYDNTSGRILQERNDYLLAQIRDFVDSKKWVNLRPEYQRRRRWDDKKQSKLIESLLMNVPVPPIFLYETELSRYEVMDGQQRLVSIIDFYNNKLRLRGLKTWADLNGLTYKELPSRLKRGLDRRRISAVTLLAESATSKDFSFTDIRREVFERLNTGGTTLNAQELRNCIYGGSFNDLIVDLARGPKFCRMWDIPAHSSSLSLPRLEKLQRNDLFSKMADCQIVLRFFAFRESKYVVGSVKSMLDNTMKRYRNADAQTINEFRRLFTSRLSMIRVIFGADAFRLPVNRGSRYSRPLFDALMIALDRLWDSSSRLKSRRAVLRSKLASLLARERTYAILIGRPNTAKALRRRISLIEKAFRSVL